MTLRRFLTRLIWLSVLPLVALAAYLVVDDVGKVERQRELAADELAHNVANAVDRHLSGQIAALHALAASPLVDSPERWPDLYRQAEDLHGNFGSHVILADAAGHMRFNTRVPFGDPLPAMPIFAGRRAAPTALATGQPTVGDQFIGPVGQQNLVAVAVPALRGDHPAFALVGVIESHEFQRQLDELELPPDWALTLRDGTGAVIAARAPAAGGPASEDMMRVVEASNLSQWQVEVRAPRGLSSAETRAVLAKTLLLLLGATLAGVIGGQVAGRRLSRALVSLAYPRGGPGDQPAIAEIAAVRDRLDAARSRVEAANAALREGNEQLTLFIEHAPASLAMFDRDMRYLAVSRRWLDDYSLEGQAILGRSHYDVFPDLPERWREGHRRGMAGEVICCDQDRFERANGKVQWLRWEIHPWHAADGAIGGIVIFTEDITGYKAAQQEILRLNTDLEQLVAERTVELMAANRELESFAYAVSHDLRAPLRAMSGFSQALTEDHGDRLEGDAKVYLDQIDIAARKMGELIDGILSLSRITRGELRRDSIDISAMAMRLLAELAGAAPGRHVDWQVQPGLAAVGDPRMVEAVLRNLLGNAWKYTANTAQPTIRVFAGEVGGQRGFCIADNGAGFDMAHADRLFKPFQRLHRQDEFPGIGIGLATVQRIVNRHGGEILAEGRPGDGATFCFTLSSIPGRDPS